MPEPRGYPKTRGTIKVTDPRPNKTIPIGPIKVPILPGAKKLPPLRKYTPKGPS